MRPAEYRALPSAEHGVVEGLITPAPEYLEHLMVKPQKVTGDDWKSPYSSGQSMVPDPVLNIELQGRIV